MVVFFKIIFTVLALRVSIQILASDWLLTGWTVRGSNG